MRLASRLIWSAILRPADVGPYRFLVEAVERDPVHDRIHLRIPLDGWIDEDADLSGSLFFVDWFISHGSIVY